MNQRLNAFSILSWPLWLKLTVAFIVAVALPSLFILGFVFNGVAEVARQNAEVYVSENGARQWTAINEAFDHVSDGLTTFVSSPDNAPSFRSLLPGSSVASVEPLVKARFIGDLQDDLLNQPGGLFERIELLDSTGRLIVRALPGRANTLVVAEDLSGSNAYQLGVNADLLGRSQDMAITLSDGQPVIEIVNVIKLEQASAEAASSIGYLVSTLNVEALVLDHLELGSNLFEAQSYLVTPSGILITIEGARSIRPGEAQGLFNGDSSLTEFSDDELVKYASPIRGTPLQFVTEGSGRNVVGRIPGYVLARSFAMVVGLSGLVLVLVLAVNQLITPSLTRLRNAVQAMGRGNFDEPLPDAQRGDEIGQLAGSFADTRLRVQTLIDDLEGRIQARTRDLSATQEISHFAATQRDLQTLLDQVVNLIVERFPNIYHAQIFLLDSQKRYAVLRASTGEPGQKLLALGHRLGVGSASVIGQVTDMGEIVVARDTADSKVHRRNEFLPDTQAELAIPLKLGDDQIIGALDVQSRQADTFTEDQAVVLQTMADQIAIAIENARLFQESLRRLEEIERGRAAATLQAWREFMRQERTRMKISQSGQPPVSSYSDALRQSAISSGRTMVGTLTERKTIPFAVPIRLGDQVLGAVEWELPQEIFDHNQLLLAEELVNRLAISLENARLFQESQRATDRERLVNEIAARLSTQTDIDQILQTAVREVGQALHAPQVSIRLRQPDTNGNGHHSTNGHSNSGRLSSHDDTE